MHQGLQTVVESRSLGGAVVHQLVLRGKRQSQLVHLPSHFHRSEKESTLSMLLDLQTVVGSRSPEEVEGHQYALTSKHSRQLGRLPSHFHRNVRGSIVPKPQGLQTAEGFPFLIEAMVEKLVVTGKYQ